jgi:hypothetical protein
VVVSLVILDLQSLIHASIIHVVRTLCTPLFPSSVLFCNVTIYIQYAMFLFVLLSIGVRISLFSYFFVVPLSASLLKFTTHLHSKINMGVVVTYRT